MPNVDAVSTSSFKVVPTVSIAGNPVIKISFPFAKGEVEWPIEVGYDEHGDVDAAVLKAFEEGLNIAVKTVAIDPSLYMAMIPSVLIALHEAQKLSREFRGAHGLPPLPAIS